MKNKIIKLLLSILIIFFTVPVLSAQDRVADNAGILTEIQKGRLADSIASLSSKYKMDLIIVTERSAGNKTPMIFAADFFDDNGYGIGGNRDGCLLLYVTGTRDIWVSTSGRATRILNDTALDKVLDDTAENFSAGNYYKACSSFLTNWEEFLILEEKGRNYNVIHRNNIFIIIGIWVFAFGIGFLTILTWKKDMDTAIGQTHAAAYVVPGSLSFTEKKDSFLYSTITKVKREKSSTSSGGGIYTGSSGRSHGGGGRRH